VYSGVLTDCIPDLHKWSVGLYARWDEGTDLRAADQASRRRL